jgi:hypothetical protein
MKRGEPAASQPHFHRPGLPTIGHPRSTVPVALLGGISRRRFDTIEPLLVTGRVAVNVANGHSRHFVGRERAPLS